LTFEETGEPISGALIGLRIYDPDGNIFWIVAMSEVEPGVYVYQSPETVAYYVSEGIWLKGIYLVVGKAFSKTGPEARAWSMIQYHIDPPGGQGPDMTTSLTLGGFIGLLALNSLIVGRHMLKRRKIYAGGISLN
ncbi:MAG: hypothetical protein ACW98Y_20240, partial [Candidatus Thorarchaeota archaeon]